MPGTRPASPLPDQETRRRIREDLRATLFIEAAAGTGKTTALVSRMVALLVSGEGTLDRMVALTFTEKAAGELKLRVRSEMERARAEAVPDGEVRRRLDTALGHMEIARLGTIHSFCADLIRERPVESRVDPLFEVATEEDARALLDAAFDAWFESMLEDPPEGVRRVLHRRTRDQGFDGAPRASLRATVESLAEHRDYGAAWHRDSFDRDPAIDRVMEALALLADNAGTAARPHAYFAKSIAEIQRFVADQRVREAARGRNYDALEASLREFASSRHRHWTYRGRPGEWFRPGLLLDDLRDRRDQVKQEIDALLVACDADLAPLLREELRPVIEAYNRTKERAGKLDFLDLLIGARDLLRDCAEVRQHLQQRFTHFFVDEFQDTDPLQAEILLLLTADNPEQNDWRAARPAPGKLFVVGDPKQAIYRFRRADVVLYEDVKRRLVAHGAEVLALSASFRGLPQIQTVVNSAFASQMRGSADGSQASYVPMEQVRPPVEGQPAVVVLPVPRPYADYGRIAKKAIGESFPEAVAAFVDWLVSDSGWKVEENSRAVAVEPRHICILLRRFQRYRDDVTRPYVRALEARRVPHVLLGGRSYHEREEVLAVSSALTAIEWPDDELHVYATMRGPFFALQDDTLLAFRHEHHVLHPLRWRDEERRAELEGEAREVADALAVLGDLHSGRNRRPIASTLTRLLAAVRAHAGLAIWPTGEQALANCLRMTDLARRFERRGAGSFRAFVEFLEEERERGRSEDAPAVEEGSDGVRIMTVHKAKGLEFPVVILADPTCQATRLTPSRHVDAARGLWLEPLCGSVPPELRDVAAQEQDRDRAEAVRLAYVAATRARDLLVAPGIGDAVDDESASGWLEMLAPAIYPAPNARRDARPALGCPEFGEDSVLERPPGAAAHPRDSIKPGLHRMGPEGHEVVWWDPRLLRIGIEEQVGLQQQQILAADHGGVKATAGIEAHQRWQERRSRMLADGAAPRFQVQTVTAQASAGHDLEGAIQVERLDAPRDSRPGGRRFGTLVHASLAAVPFDAGPHGVRAIVETQARLIGATGEEVDTGSDLIVRVLMHSLLRRAARAAEVRRESSVITQLDDGTLVEGTLDLAFRETPATGGASWTVVDFKTDREFRRAQARYESQLRLYVKSVERSTGEAVVGVLLVL